SQRGGWASCLVKVVGVGVDLVPCSHQERVRRIPPFAARLLPGPPRFHPGQRVQVRPNGNLSSFAAPVRKLDWHFKNGHYVYWLEGKSTRYPESDLELA